jgi:hypothetical protein
MFSLIHKIDVYLSSSYQGSTLVHMDEASEENFSDIWFQQSWRISHPTLCCAVRLVWVILSDLY